MSVCDVCGRESEGPFVTRRLYSARREEDLKDAAWATSRVTLHFSDFQTHDVQVGPECRREARRFYLLPAVPALVSAVLYLIWVSAQPSLAPRVAAEYVVLPVLVPVVLFFWGRHRIRKQYGMGETGFGETPLRMFSLNSYLIMRLTEVNPSRTYWNPKWYKRYRDRFE